jgi:integrase
VSWRDHWGKQHWRYFGRADGAGTDDRLEEARVFDAQIRNRGRSGPVPVRAPDPAALRFEQLLARYLRARMGEVRPKSLRDITSMMVRHALPIIGKIPCRAVAMNHMLEILARLGELSMATRNRMAAYIKAVFNWGVRYGFIEKNPFLAHKLRREPQVNIPPPSAGELFLILKEAPDHLRWAIAVAWYTGCRPGASELFALRWSDVDWVNGGLWLYRPKTGTKWFLPLKDTFMATMKEMAGKADCEWVVSYEGRQVKSLKTAWAAAKRRAGVTRRLRLYDIRHAYGSGLLAAGADLKSVAHLMGHASTDTTMRHYIHMVAEAPRQSAELVQDLLLPPPRNDDGKKR